jgi:Flp pilus assembly pilin Flp
MTWIRRFFRDERGEDLIEYGLLVAFVASIAMGIVIGDPLNLQAALINAYQRAIDALYAA